MRLIPDSNNIARIIEIPGVKKTTEYLFIGTGFALVALGSVCYLITAIKSHGRIKEQNDVFANKQREIEIASLCKMQENEQFHIHRMQEERKRMSTGTNWQNIKSDNCIKRNRGKPRGSNRFKIFLENLSTNDRRFPLTEEGPGCEPN